MPGYSPRRLARPSAAIGSSALSDPQGGHLIALLTDSIQTRSGAIKGSKEPGAFNGADGFTVDEVACCRSSQRSEAILTNERACLLLMSMYGTSRTGGRPSPDKDACDRKIAGHRSLRKLPTAPHPVSGAER